MNLNSLEVQGVNADAHGHLQAITRAVFAIRGGQVCEVGATLVKQRICAEVDSKPTGGYAASLNTFDALDVGGYHGHHP